MTRRRFRPLALAACALSLALVDTEVLHGASPSPSRLLAPPATTGFLADVAARRIPIVKAAGERVHGEIWVTCTRGEPEDLEHQCPVGARPKHRQARSGDTHIPVVEHGKEEGIASRVEDAQDFRRAFHRLEMHPNTVSTLSQVVSGAHGMFIAHDAGVRRREIDDWLT